MIRTFLLKRTNLSALRTRQDLHFTQLSPPTPVVEFIRQHATAK